MVVQGSHNEPGTNFHYLALGLGIDGDDALCEVFDSERILDVIKQLKGAYGLVSALERYCGFQMRSQSVSIVRLDVFGGIGRGIREGIDQVRYR